MVFLASNQYSSTRTISRPSAGGSPDISDVRIKDCTERYTRYTHTCNPAATYQPICACIGKVKEINSNGIRTIAHNHLDTGSPVLRDRL